MKLQTYKMYEGEDTVYVERDDVLKALEQEPCEERIVEWKKDFKEYVNLLTMPRDDYNGIMEYIDELPSINPKFTDAEIQKMQDLEQAQLDKAYELGKAEIQPCEDCISRTEALKHSHIEYDDDGVGHRVVYVEDIKELPTVTPKAGSEDKNDL